MKITVAMRRWGWRCFALAWIPFAGFFIGMSSMPEGSYDWVELPLLARVSMIAMGILFGVSMLLLIGASLAGGGENQKLLENGQPA